MHVCVVLYKSSVFQYGTIEILVWVAFLWHCPVYCRVCSFYLLDASSAASPPRPPTKLPVDIAKCPLGDTNQ